MYRRPITAESGNQLLTLDCTSTVFDDTVVYGLVNTRYLLDHLLLQLVRYLPDHVRLQIVHTQYPNPTAHGISPCTPMNVRLRRLLVTGW